MVDKDSRNKLMDAATRLFALKGYAAVSIRELAQAAAVNSALINYHFGGKDGLYLAVLESNFSMISDSLRHISESSLPFAEKLIQFMKFLMHIHQSNPYLRKLMTSELNSPTPYFETIVKRYIMQIYKFAYTTLGEAIKYGEIRADFHPAFTIIAISGMINFFYLAQPIVDELIPPDPERDQNYLANLVRILFEGLPNVPSTGC
jgi:TetR/AcrR family transcriptional regulator